MWRAVALAVALALLAAAPTASGSATCSAHLTWHATSYRAVSTLASVKAGSALGNGTLHTCTAPPVPPGYAARTAGVAASALIRPVFAVPGVRSKVAVALKSASRTSLYVSRTTPTAAERAVLKRLRG
jgi:hypothetical protein